MSADPRELPIAALRDGELDGLPASREEAAVQLAAVCRIAAMHGMDEGIDNHFSALVPGAPDRFLLNPYGSHWSEVRAGDLIEADLDGKLIEGRAEQVEPTAIEIHRAVHAAHPEARAVLHTHMPYASAVCVQRDGFDAYLSQNSLRFVETLATIGYGGLGDNEDEARRLARPVADGKRVLLMEGHGAMVVGGSVALAWKDLYFLERACRVQILAQSTASSLLRIGAEDAAPVVAALEEERWSAPLLLAAEMRRLDRVTPGYAD